MTSESKADPQVWCHQWKFTAGTFNAACRRQGKATTDHCLVSGRQLRDEEPICLLGSNFALGPNLVLPKATVDVMGAEAAYLAAVAPSVSSKCPPELLPAGLRSATVVATERPANNALTLQDAVRRFLVVWDDSDAFDSSRMTDEMTDVLDALRVVHEADTKTPAAGSRHVDADSQRWLTLMVTEMDRIGDTLGVPSLSKHVGTATMDEVVARLHSYKCHTDVPSATSTDDAPPRFRVGNVVRIERCVDPSWWNYVSRLDDFVGEQGTISTMSADRASACVSFANLTVCWFPVSSLELVASRDPNKPYLFPEPTMDHDDEGGESSELAYWPRKDA